MSFQEAKKVLWIAKDSVELVEKLSTTKIMNAGDEEIARVMLNQIIIEAQDIMKGEGPTSKANNVVEFPHEEVRYHKLGI